LVLINKTLTNLRLKSKNLRIRLKKQRRNELNLKNLKRRWKTLMELVF